MRDIIQRVKYAFSHSIMHQRLQCLVAMVNLAFQLPAYSALDSVALNATIAQNIGCF